MLLIGLLGAAAVRGILVYINKPRTNLNSSTIHQMSDEMVGKTQAECKAIQNKYAPGGIWGWLQNP